MSEMDRSSEHRVRLLSRAGIPSSVAINDDAPLYLHRLSLLDRYGVKDVRFFRNHLDCLEQSGRSKAFGQCDILDRVAVTDPRPGDVKLVQVMPSEPVKARSSKRCYNNEEGTDAP